MHGYLRFLGLSFLATVLASPSVLTAQTHQVLQTKFDEEDDVMHRAKMMTKLSRALTALEVEAVLEVRRVLPVVEVVDRVLVAVHVGGVVAVTPPRSVEAGRVAPRSRP